MVHYYDAILASIGFLLLIGAVTALLTTPLVLIAFAVGAMALMAHGMAVRPPTGSQESQESNALSNGSAVSSD